MVTLISLIINIMKLFIKKKSYILRGVILPAFVIIFFTFEFGNEYKFKVGIVDKDNSYVSEEVIKVIDELEDVETVNIKEKDYKMLLVSQQIQMAIIINDGFQEKLLNNEDNNIIIKSINESDVNAVIKNMIELKCEDLSMISNISDKDINNFKRINENYKDEGTKLSLNDIDESRPQIEKSLGLIMFIVFIICGNISNFLIEDEENKTKIPILSSGISKWKYYFSLVFVFYIMSFSTIFVYYLFYVFIFYFVFCFVFLSVLFYFFFKLFRFIKSHSCALLATSWLLYYIFLKLSNSNYVYFMSHIYKNFSLQYYYFKKSIALKYSTKCCIGKIP